MRGVLLMTPEQHESSHALFNLLRAEPDRTAARLVAMLAAQAERDGKPHLRLTLWQVNTKLVRWVDGGKVVRALAPRPAGWRLGRRPFVYRLRWRASLPVADFAGARERYNRCAAMFAALQASQGMTAGALAALGEEPIKLVSTRLSAWKRRGLVTCAGACRAMLWTVLPGAEYPPYDEFVARQDARRRDPSKSITKPAGWVAALVPKRVHKQRPVARSTSQEARA